MLMPEYDTLEYEVDDGAAVIRLDRPEKRNALNEQLIGELVDALHTAEDTDDVRAVVIAGNGPAFSSGYDLSDAGLEDDFPDMTHRLWDPRRTVHRHVFAIHELHVPVIAAVDGPALAGGSDLAGVSDITIATEDAEFGYPAVRMGGLPVTLTYPFVMNNIKYTKELLLTGKTIDAERAAEIGWVNRVVSADDLMDEVREEVDQIKKVPSLVSRLTKRQLASVMETQGFSPTVTDSANVAALAHLPEESREFNRMIDEDGLGPALEYMYNEDKS